ncbi:hypothetical protein AB8Z38_09000 [Bradyrhizobium sp. LLZ17]|uniref:Uncharacterized protein n=1 Tax=Bradyrhizobium sp. LLZ17 TaxID=3239388 RepID=A0AB39XQN6_9BRAD
MLLVRAFAGLVFLFATISVVLFGSAGTLHVGRAWMTLAVFLDAPRRSPSGCGFTTRRCWNGA